MALRTEIRILGDVIVLCCGGRLVIGQEITAFRAEVKKLLSERHGVVLDLSEIEHIDSMGLAALVRLFTGASSEKREIRLVCSGQHVTDLLRRTRLDKVLTVYTSEQEAIARFAETRYSLQGPKSNLSKGHSPRFPAVRQTLESVEKLGPGPSFFVGDAGPVC